VTLPQRITGALTRRFRHFDPVRAACLFDPADPFGDYRPRGEDRTYPAFRMSNGVLWFYDREDRPTRSDGTPMKSKAPRGGRRFLCGPDAAELMLVEGEGHAAALVSLGIPGIVACGGVSVFETDKAWARHELDRVMRGKAVRIAFDFDEAGKRASVRVARKLLACGAARVGILPKQPWPDGADIGKQETLPSLLT